MRERGKRRKKIRLRFVKARQISMTFAVMIPKLSYTKN